MSYISAAVTRDRNNVIVWYRDENRRRVTHMYPAPYYFYYEDDYGEYTSVDGKKLSKAEFNNANKFKKAKELYNDERLYESDLAPEIKVLLENYYNEPETPINITFFDIEVDYNKDIGFASPDNPYAPINSVAVHHHWSGETTLICVPPSEDITYEDIADDIKQDANVIFCHNERELLINFLAQIQDSDIISGWNSKFFDLPYIYRRIENVFDSERWAQQLSFKGAQPPRYRPIKIVNNGVERMMPNVDIHGRASLDYLELFKKYEVAERPSYKLESIAEEECPDLPKLDYHGSLADLYKRDFNHFLRYNIRDTIILKALEDKLGYVNLAVQMYRMSCGLPNQVVGTIKLAELSLIGYCHHELNVIVPDTVIHEKTEKIAGAWVIRPNEGMHEYVASVDVTSLYPSCIRSINISPEKKVGQCVNKKTDFYKIANKTDEPVVIDIHGRAVKKSGVEWYDWMRENGIAISGYGTLFDQQSGDGIVPKILSQWFGMRKEYKALAKENFDKAQDILQTAYERG